MRSEIETVVEIQRSTKVSLVLIWGFLYTEMGRNEWRGNVKYELEMVDVRRSGK